MIRLFSDTLRELRQGMALDELTTELNKVVTAVESTGKPGEITFTLKLKASTAGAIEVADIIKSKIPELGKSSSLFFATPEGNLVRNDPRQKDLPGLKSIETETKEVKEVKHG